MLRKISFFLLLTITLCGAVQIKKREYNEWRIFQLLQQIVPLDPVIVYGGGYDGEDVVTLASMWRECKIYAFEPNHAFFKILEKKTSKLANVKATSFALSSQKGRADFFLSSNEANKRIGSLLESNQRWKWYYDDSTKISVQCINLQEYIQTQKTKIDLLWLDIGGSELSILQSIPKLLPDIQVIVLETHLTEFRQGMGLYPDVKKLLNSCDFEEIYHWHTKEFHGLAVFAKKGSVEVIK